MTGRQRRIAAAAAALAAYAACGDSTITEEAGPIVHETPRLNHRHTQDTPESFIVDLPRPTTARVARSRPRPAAPVRNSPPAGDAPSADVRTVSSTAYCLTGTMANGQKVYQGAVAMNGVPLGSVWQVDGGGTYTVADRIGHSSGFDIAMPGDCAAARAYGRRTITVRRVA